MAIRATTKWLIVCLYYNEPWEEFLVKAVKTYTDVVLQTGVAERFYWQRSWDRGPHIRLWFKGNPFVLETMLKPNLQEHFQHYFESKPSFLLEPKYPDGFPMEFKWLPNNSVQYNDYEPELDRLGGWLELSLCEKQYQCSSLLVLKTLREKAGKYTHDEMTSTAIKFHLSLAYAVGMSMEEARLFFQWMADSWVHEFEKTGSKKPGHPEKDVVYRSFARIFDLQKKDIVPYHAALWEIFKNYRKINDPLFVEWFHINANASLELNLAIESGKLRVQPLPPSPMPGVQPEPIWQFYAEFVKLTNNRLGILNKNEGFLFFLISQSLNAVSSGVASMMKVVDHKDFQ